MFEGRTRLARAPLATIDITGRNFTATHYRNVTANPRAAFVVAGFLLPFRPRSVLVHDLDHTVTTGDGAMIRIVPEVATSRSSTSQRAESGFQSSTTWAAARWRSPSAEPAAQGPPRQWSIRW